MGTMTFFTFLPGLMGAAWQETALPGGSLGMGPPEGPFPSLVNPWLSFLMCLQGGIGGVGFKYSGDEYKCKGRKEVHFGGRVMLPG